MYLGFSENNLMYKCVVRFKSGSKNVTVFRCPNRSVKTLTGNIAQYVFYGSIISTDAQKAYGCLTRLRSDSCKVVREENYIDPQSEIHTRY